MRDVTGMDRQREALAVLPLPGSVVAIGGEVKDDGAVSFHSSRPALSFGRNITVGAVSNVARRRVATFQMGRMAPWIATRDDCIESAFNDAGISGLGGAKLAGFVHVVVGHASVGKRGNLLFVAKKVVALPGCSKIACRPLSIDLLRQPDLRTDLDGDGVVDVVAAKAKVGGGWFNLVAASDEVIALSGLRQLSASLRSIESTLHHARFAASASRSLRASWISSGRTPMSLIEGILSDTISLGSCPPWRWTSPRSCAAHIGLIKSREASAIFWRPRLMW
ncbi:MAG: hypothetical protein B7Y80_13655 [Hyphomicrobium sp. 32-62-53]|nr:MAG: hypothetical protein B7Z29_12565 [Hyphomicrobium sp. 12-62-95]OYX99071.1 MAG: hypothetical protein B7Y80_13655 [Hyphomicrobium sp. 32-62-53]